MGHASREEEERDRQREREKRENNKMKDISSSGFRAGHATSIEP